MKIGLVASRLDKASMGILEHLKGYIKFREVREDYYESDLAPVLVSRNDIVYADEASKWAKDLNLDLLIFLSRHSMERPRPMITLHTPGNWGSETPLGGKPSFVAISEPRVLSNLYRLISSRIGELQGYEANIEATHHGPAIDGAAIFVEIGSTEAEWGDVKAQEFVAGIIYELLSNPGRFMSSGRPVAVSIGDLHYVTLARHVLQGEYDLGHVVPKYVKVDERVIEMAVNRNSVRPDIAIIHWKALKRDERELAKAKLMSMGVNVVKRG